MGLSALPQRDRFSTAQTAEPGDHRNRKAAQTRPSSLREELDVLLDGRADDSTGATKRRTLLSFYAAPTSAPTRASSPRQLPTDHDHAVPTREYQSDQSSHMLLG